MVDSKSVVLGVFVLLLFVSPAFAQLDTGTISGTVADQTGAAVPGASVAIKNVATGIVRRLVTNEAGRYEAVALPIGTYEVTASLAGFLSPTTLNEFAFGFNRSQPAQSFPNNEPDWKNFNGVNLLFIPDRERMGQLTYGDGVANMGFPRDRALFFQDFYTYRDSLSITRTNHTFKIGAEYNPMRLVMDQVDGSYNGLYSFNTFHAFLTGDVNQVESDLPPGFPLRGGQIHQAIKVFNWRQKQLGAYFQDNWKVRPSLTLNLGLRYEFMTIPKEDNGHVSNLLHITDPVPTIGPNLMFNNPTKRNFSPRFGFAWAPGRTGRSAIRGGFGVYYDLPGPQYWRSHSQENVPFVVAGFFNKSDVIRAQGPGASIDFPRAIQTQTALLAQVPSYRLWELNNKPSYVYRWSLSLERQFGNWFGQMAYNG